MAIRTTELLRPLDQLKLGRNKWEKLLMTKPILKLSKVLTTASGNTKKSWLKFAPILWGTCNEGQPKMDAVLLQCSPSRWQYRPAGRQNWRPNWGGRRSAKPG